MEAGTLVLHMDLDGSGNRSRADGHCSVAVPKCVVDQVSERLLDAEPVGAHPRARRDVDTDLPAGGRSSLGEPPGDRAGELLEVERLRTQRHFCLVELSHDEQVLRQTNESLSLVGGAIGQAAR